MFKTFFVLTHKKQILHKSNSQQKFKTKNKKLNSKTRNRKSSLIINHEMINDKKNF